MMPDGTGASADDIRSNYGLDGRTTATAAEPATAKKQNPRPEEERAILLSALERIARHFYSRLARGETTVENGESHVEELCAVIELCLQHGWKRKRKGTMGTVTGC